MARANATLTAEGWLVTDIYSPRLSDILSHESAVAEAAGSAADDNTSELSALVALAGVGGEVRLVPNKVYRTWGGLRLLSGQKLYGNGATIVRKAQVSSAYVSSSANNSSFSTTFATSSHRYVRVSNASLFTVGAVVCLTNNDGAGDGYSTGYYAATPTVNYTDAVRITAIDTGTNTLTLERAPVQKYTAGGGTPALDNSGATYVVTSGALLYVDNFSSDLTKGAWASRGSGVRIFDLNIDEDRTNQAKARWWDVACSIWVCSDDFQAVGCTFDNIMGEGIIHSGVGGLVDRCEFTDLNGNAVHPSAWDVSNGSQDLKVRACNSTRSNLDPTIGHATGSFTISTNVTGLKYHACTARNSGSYGFLGLAVATNASLEILGCDAFDCSRGAWSVSGSVEVSIVGGNFANNGADTPSAAVWVTAIESATKNVSVSGGVYKNSPILVRGTVESVSINGAVFEETASRGSTWKLASLYLEARGKTVINGCQFRCATAASTNMDGIYINSTASEVTVSGCMATKMGRGFRLNGAPKNVRIANNKGVDCWHENFVFNASSGHDGVVFEENDSIMSSSVVVGTNCASGASLMRINPAGTYVRIANNVLRSYVTSGSGTLYLLLCTGATFLNIIGNDIRRDSYASHSATINISAGTADATLRMLGNLLSHAYSVAAGTPTLVWNGTGDSNIVA